MKTKTIAILSSLLAISAVTGCKKEPTEQPIKDIWGVVPELDYNGSLDIFCYIVGQNGVVNDIGSVNNKAALFDASLAKYHGAAKAWKEFYPNIKINVHYGGIDDYDINIRNYQSMHNNHLPHLMHLPTTPQEGIAKGYNVDLSQYSYLSYYQAVNPNLFNYFTFGGFVSAVPMYIYPTGIFVNTKILRDEFLISEEDDYVSSFTFAEMVKWAKETANTERAGMGYLSEDILFNSAKTINYGLLNNRRVQLNTPEIRQTLELENELAAYTCWDFAGGKIKDSYDFIKPYAYNTNFIDDQNYTMESSRAYCSLLFSQMINENDDVGNFDFLPMPKLTEDDQLSIGVIAEGLVVGNQCPVNATCSENDKLAQEAAAAFALFMNVDTRAYEEMSKVEWSYQGKTNIGAVETLPVIRTNFRFSYNDNMDNPNDYYQQLEIYKELRSAFRDQPGFNEVLRIYEEEPENTYAYNTIPRKVPSGISEEKDILEDFHNRFKGDDGINFGTTAWTGWVNGNLTKWENEVNQNLANCYALLQEQLNNYYGDGKYDVESNKRTFKWEHEK